MADETTIETATEMLRRQHAEIFDLFAEMSESLDVDLAEDWDRLHRLISAHEQAEEEFLYPAAQRAGVPDSLIELRIGEETEAKRLLADLAELGPDGDGFVELLFDEFRPALSDHAREEEHEVFPRIEEHLDQARLKELAHKLAEAEAAGPAGS